MPWIKQFRVYSTAQSSVAERKEAEDMRSLRSFLVALFLVALLLVAAGATAVGAASPNQVAGEITVGPNSGSVAEVEFTGSLLGPAIEVYTLIVHDSGKVDVHGCGSFTGTFEGRTGTFTYHFNGHGEGTSLAGQITIDRGTGDLSGIKGHFSFEGAGSAFTYDGWVAL
jgi:Protein of unknown function (DUF3224)